MATILKPWPYQREAIDAGRKALDSGRYDDREPKGPAIVLPTGAGKTVVFAHLASEWLADHPGTRVLELSHRTELVEQARQKFADIAPHLRVGVVKAETNQAAARIVCASVQTLSGKGGPSRRSMIEDVSLVIVDEAHHAPSESYRQVMRHYAERGARFLGVTATMVRADKKALGEVWPEVVYQRSIAETIAEGYLVRPRGIRVKVADLDLGKVKRTAGDYNLGELGTALTDSLAPAAIAKAYREHAAERSGILFAPTVDSARACCDALNEEGFTTAVVYDGMSPDDRKLALKRFTAGEVQILANCMILTEGTDLPLASCAVIARCTQSIGLFVQMVGRVLRLHPGKSDALVLDVTGVGLKHRLTSPIDLFAEESGMIIEDDEAHLGEDGELVLDLLGESEERGGGAVGEAEGRDGPLEHEEFDLFGSSRNAWMRTKGGTWFLPGINRYIAIVRGDRGGYSVISVPALERGGRYVIEDVSDMGAAMAWAEQDVSGYEQRLIKRSHVSKVISATKSQREWLKACGLWVNGMGQGEASEVMTGTLASRRIDPVVTAFYGGAA